MRLARPLALLMVLTAVLAACAAESTPGWTFAPTPTPTVAPSSEPAGRLPPRPRPPARRPRLRPTAATAGPWCRSRSRASGIAFDTDTLEVPADTPFQIVFTNNDAGIPHNVAIHEGSPTGPAVWTGEIFNGVETRTYDVPALPAGSLRLRLHGPPQHDRHPDGEVAGQARPAPSAARGQPAPGPGRPCGPRLPGRGAGRTPASEPRTRAGAGRRPALDGARRLPSRARGIRRRATIRR